MIVERMSKPPILMTQRAGKVRGGINNTFLGIEKTFVFFLMEYKLLLLLNEEILVSVYNHQNLRGGKKG